MKDLLHLEKIMSSENINANAVSFVKFVNILTEIADVFRENSKTWTSGFKPGRQ